jgi:DNA polymerase/3'-5' exonuclease PolX
VSDGKRIPLEDGQRIADQWMEKLRPLCDRVEVAGSIRRQKTDVGDVELVALPRMAALYDVQALLGPKFLNFLTDQEHRQAKLGGYFKDPAWVKAKALEVAARVGKPVRVKGEWPGGMTQLALPQGICLDLFTPSSPDAWGLIHFIRTGCAEFTRAMATHSARLGYIWHEGRIYRRFGHGKEAKPDGPAFSVPEEDDVFRFFGVRWVGPFDRTDEAVLWAAVISEPKRKQPGPYRR